MLNISENSISKFINISDYKSYASIKRMKVGKIKRYLVTGVLVVILIGMFLPWTQNIRAKGYVTTRLPQQHPQSIHSVLAGRIEQWYVSEGDYVAKGDTIIYISEVKSEYFDPNLLQRTTEQIDAKQQSIDSYDLKIAALRGQYIALKEALNLKREQIRNKITQAHNKVSIDSIDLAAYKNNFSIAENQYIRTKELYEKGLKTLSELQEKEYKKREAEAKVGVQQNKWLNQKNELTVLSIELLAVDQEYADKLAKSQSDLQSAVSAKMESMATVSKMKSVLSNYDERQKYYYITAPQSGYITKINKKGLGETIKEGTDIAIIVPDEYDLAVEIYLKPNDLPLLNVGDRVRLRFDGWPAIVISGWPDSATGVFAGNIIAIEQFISANGYYRILVSPDDNTKSWPQQLRVGAGVEAFVLLRDVPVWYEIWRQLNGFPADYYQGEKVNVGNLKRKAPLKSVK
ncbi:HlyD family efflux transporter periplasmic adaptor subunit [Labilibacter sediminis]|nr:HlyD family efflux transporter periplasmic adaptor subunit [Labilibacter sediminis]